MEEEALCCPSRGVDLFQQLFFPIFQAFIKWKGGQGDLNVLNKTVKRKFTAVHLLTDSNFAGEEEEGERKERVRLARKSNAVWI